jgi:hypothetical protein
MRKKLNEWPEWPNARDWVGIACFFLTVGLLLMMWVDQTLLKDDFFKTIATLIIGTGFINSVVGWAYGSTKQGSELAERNAVVVEKTATDAANSTNTNAGDQQNVSG